MVVRIVTNFLLFRLGKTRNIWFPEYNLEERREGAFTKTLPGKLGQYNSQYQVIFITENLKSMIALCYQRKWDLVFPSHCQCTKLHKTANTSS